MIDRQHPLSVVQQCQILAIARSSIYAVPPPIAAATLALMRQIDELHLQHPYAGSRMLRDLLRL
jgi:putative transposase